ncbi:MAG: MotE family protein [Caulobacteraceae bacterium]
MAVDEGDPLPARGAGGGRRGAGAARHVRRRGPAADVRGGQGLRRGDGARRQEGRRQGRRRDQEPGRRHRPSWPSRRRRRCRPPPPSPSPPAPAPAVCAPTPAELAKQAGMSPAELQVLQSLGSRRNQLDAREQNLDTQLQLLAAAEAKVDTKLKQLAGLKGDIQGLLGQADAKKESEMARLVTIYEQMKPQDAAVRMTLLDDSVRLPLAAKMNVRKLSAIMGFMPPADAKAITEKLADRLTAADQARAALASASAASAAQASAKTPARAAAAGGDHQGVTA